VRDRLSMSDLTTDPAPPVVGVFFSERMQAGRFRLGAGTLTKQRRMQSLGPTRS
jgi:hypothetical protein